jgi:hypothetical protein
LEADGFVFALYAATVRPGQRGVQVRCRLPLPFEPQPLQEQKRLKHFVQTTLRGFGGIGRSSRLVEKIDYNLAWLEDGGWQEVEKEIGRLRRNRTQRSEVRAADFIDDKLKGFGSKQSRNLLQRLGLTKYEIHIDSRITGWLHEFGFPVALSPSLPLVIFVSPNWRLEPSSPT